MKLTKQNFYKKIKIGDKEIDGRFIMPSGIRSTKASVIDFIFNNIPSIGIITTKSISTHERRGYREPIYVEYAERSYINAVGLENPGAEKFKDEFKNIQIPSNKFLLISIFGENIDEFVETAKILESLADGFELNMSCPHVKGFGLEIGHDPKMVSDITHEVVKNVKVPIFVKLSASCVDIGLNAKAAIDAGAIGISIINTVGPSMHFENEAPILYNKVGGLSGNSIRPIGLRSVSRVKDSIGKPPFILGMGGISSAKHIREYYLCGADFFGIGSSLTRLNTNEFRKYMQLLQTDLLNNTNEVERFLAENYRKIKYSVQKVLTNIKLKGELFKLVIDDHRNFIKNGNIDGLFYFLCIPGVGEKPFAIFSSEEKSFIIKNIGYFTNYLSEISNGSTIYIRGPYGKRLPNLLNKKIYLVGGGTGIVPLFEIARKYKINNQIILLLGSKTKMDLFELEKFKDLGEIFIATEDGSLGFHGLITELLKEKLSNENGKNELIFFNSGPEKMVIKCFEIEKEAINIENIYGTIPYHTSCGVGICGKCATPTGFLSCVDGPFFKLKEIINKLDVG